MVFLLKTLGDVGQHGSGRVLVPLCAWDCVQLRRRWELSRGGLRNIWDKVHRLPRRPAGVRQWPLRRYVCLCVRVCVCELCVCVRVSLSPALCVRARARVYVLVCVCVCVCVRAQADKWL